METGRAPKPFYRNWRYIIPVAVVVVLLLVSLFAAIPKSSEDTRPSLSGQGHRLLRQQLQFNYRAHTRDAWEQHLLAVL